MKEDLRDVIEVSSMVVVGAGIWVLTIGFDSVGF
jgi:hypothetical protein